MTAGHARPPGRSLRNPDLQHCNEMTRSAAAIGYVTNWGNNPLCQKVKTSAASASRLQIFVTKLNILELRLEKPCDAVIEFREYHKVQFFLFFHTFFFFKPLAWPDALNWSWNESLTETLQVERFSKIRGFLYHKIQSGLNESCAAVDEPETRRCSGRGPVGHVTAGVSHLQSKQRHLLWCTGRWPQHVCGLPSRGWRYSLTILIRFIQIATE